MTGKREARASGRERRPPGDSYRGSGRRFAFVDRDGTLVEDRGYVHRIEDYVRLPGAVEGLRLLAAAGFRLAIVTNQSGIARGLYGVAEFLAFQAHLERDFAAHGVRFDAVYFCPHLPEADCVCRKPKPGMLERARRELGADLASSVVIGDSARDAGLARAAGCRAICVRTGKGAATLRSELPADVPVAADLVAAARLALTPPG
jgi:D-glycero-D-manno-heptose 1,7-bisphosphate phosphatase